MIAKHVLFLFSSNTTPTYEQDVLNVLAAPQGALYHFRYRQSWLNGPALENWSRLQGTRVIVHFSLQQEAEFHEPALLPVRSGTVKSTEVVGEFYLVRFLVGPYVALLPPDPTDRKSYAAHVKKYLQCLDGHDAERPYAKWASLARDFTEESDCPLDHKADQPSLFQRNTEYLSRTRSFRDARFFFVAGLKGTTENTVSPKDGVFPLDGGKTYELSIIHYQPKEVLSASPFMVTTDGQIARVIGRGGFDIGSRYDRLSISIYAARSADNRDEETDLAIDPSRGVQGPRVRLRLRVVAPAVQKTVASGITAALILGAGLPGAVPDLQKSGIVIAVAGLAFLASFWGFSRFVSQR